MRTDARPLYRQRWLIISNALVQPRKAEEIARHCGVSKARVHQVISTYNRLGVVAVETAGKGGRRHQYLTREEEEQFLAPFSARAQAGEIATVREITNAGMLFFGYDPQQYIIQADVACVLFRETIGASRYADRKFVTGTLQELIDGAEAFLNRYIAVGARVEGWKRIDIPEYSLEVLREALINVVVHRDYSKRGESIRVFYYPDRVEVQSPGLLLPGITVEQMERGEVQSKLRNTILAGLLRDIPGYMERIGSGIRFMLDETKHLGLPTPRFRETEEFIVTFHKAPALLPPPVHPQD